MGSNNTTSAFSGESPQEARAFRFAVVTDGGLIVQEVPISDERGILSHLQRAVGGYIERVDVGHDGLDGFANKEGHGLAYNHNATRVVRALSGLPYSLVGPVVFASHTGGTVHSITDEHLALVVAEYNRVAPYGPRVSVSPADGSVTVDQ
ncbi:hypothetical protein ACFQ1S_02070 [Kibdelosporangium lantanae]|uniref:DUF3846 domain-containing protein n=1 Tax=Kibdelosporangium lantanae TaxID=1497396 RepID=A0ABW3M197_9PSEU